MGFRGISASCGGFEQGFVGLGAWRVLVTLCALGHVSVRLASFGGFVRVSGRVLACFGGV